MRSRPPSDLQLLWDWVWAIPVSRTGTPGEIGGLAEIGRASWNEWADLLGETNKHLRRNNWRWSRHCGQEVRRGSWTGERERERERERWRAKLLEVIKVLKR